MTANKKKAERLRKGAAKRRALAKANKTTRFYYGFARLIK